MIYVISPYYACLESTPVLITPIIKESHGLRKKLITIPYAAPYYRHEIKINAIIR